MIVRKLYYIVPILVKILWFLRIQNTVATRIECIPIQLCPLAMKLIKTKPYAPETIGFLRYSHCGYEGKEPKVWCTLFLFCKTPDSRNGVCKNVNECDPYLDYLQNVDTTDTVVKKYLREFRCSTDFDPEIRICCPDEGKFTTKDVHDRFSTILPDPNLGECGQQSSENKIVGGTETYIGEYPWIALIKYIKNKEIQYACGGSLISEQYVVTAAHCVDPYIISRKNLGKLYSVVLGEFDTRTETDCIRLKFGEDCADPIQEFKVYSHIIHPNYDSTTMVNDIAIIRLNGKAKLSEYVKPICLPPPKLFLQGNQSFVISGWGRTETRKRSPIMRKARLDYVDRENCDKLNGRRLTERQICVGTGNGVDSCYGDSGGPLMLDKKTGSGLSTFIIGIVSYGYGQLCGSFPGVYTYLPPYIDWIDEQIK